MISQLNSRNSDEYCTLEKSFVEVLDKFAAPKMRKIFRGNQKPHVNETLSSAITKRSHSKNDKVNVIKLLN